MSVRLQEEERSSQYGRSVRDRSIVDSLMIDQWEDSVADRKEGGKDEEMKVNLLYERVHTIHAIHEGEHRVYR